MLIIKLNRDLSVLYKENNDSHFVGPSGIDPKASLETKNDVFVPVASNNRVSIRNELLCLYYQKSQIGSILELSKKFESIWRQNIWPKLINQKSVDILFIIGNQAGFTDSRVISIWLNSFSLFCGVNINLAKHLEFKDNPDNNEYLNWNLEMILKRVEWSKTISKNIYTRDPNINLAV